MSMWSFYELNTGLFTGMRQSGRRLVGVPQGCGAIEGSYDRRVQRVDIATGAVVAYQRPQVEIDAEQRIALNRKARARIDRLERAQHRRVRELLAVDDPQLAEIDREIAELRKDLAG